jgi:hypothetical protein
MSEHRSQGGKKTTATLSRPGEAVIVTDGSFVSGELLCCADDELRQRVSLSSQFMCHEGRGIHVASGSRSDRLPS